MTGNKLKVIIADDEAIFREYLRTAVDWESLGLLICCEARNGMEALEMAKNHMPDIALVDINMPFMDGLTLSEKLKEVSPETAIVLITGYNEFEYARRAIKLGVADYILKPFEKEELIDILKKIKCLIHRSHEEKTTIEKTRVLMKENLLNNLITNEYNGCEEEMRKQLRYLGIETNLTDFIVTSVEIDDLYQNCKDMGEILLRKQTVRNALGEITRKGGNNLVFYGPEGRILSIAEAEVDQPQENARMEDYQKLCGHIARNFGFTVTAGMGRAYKGFGGIRNSYVESLIALQNKLILGNNRVINYSKLGQEYSNVGFYASNINEDILIHLRMHDWDKIAEKLEEIFHYMDEKRLSIDYRYIICTGMISICLSFIIETGYEIKEIFGENFLPFSEMKSKTSIESLREWLTGLFRKTVDYCGRDRVSKSQKTVEAAIEYIHHYFGNSDLSVEYISNQLYINSSHLRAIFKRETGLTVSDYITKIRMHKAKELLNAGNAKLSWVSERVGYEDASYFSKCFKKYFGISPSQYEYEKSNSF